MPQSRLVGSLLSPALRFWLRSQTEGLGTLALDIQGRDRQILTGHIPGVILAAHDAIYQGLYLSQVDMKASAICVNIGQVVRGQPLRLLEPITVETQVFLSESDVSQSLRSPLLQTALRDLWGILYAQSPPLRAFWDQQEWAQPEWDLATGEPEEGNGAIASLPFERLQFAVQLGDDSLEFYVTGGPDDSLSPRLVLGLKAELAVLDGHVLCLQQPQVWSQELPHADGDWMSGLSDLSLVPDGKCLSLDPIQIDVGSDIAIDSLRMECAGITCVGTLMVRP